MQTTLQRLFILLFTLMPLWLLAQKKVIEQPWDYNNYIVEVQNEVMTKNLRYLEYLANATPDAKAEKLRVEMVQSFQLAVTKLKNLKTLPDDGGFKEETIKGFELALEAFEEDYQHANAISRKGDPSFEAMQEWYALLDAGDRKIDDACDQIQEAQEAFAKIQNEEITYQRNPLEDQLTALGEMSPYRRAIHLAYYSSKQATRDFMEALDANDPEKMEELREQAVSDAQRSRQLLKKAGNFQGFTALNTTASALIEFHADLAENGFKDMVKYKAAGKSATQEDVDGYNAVIRKLNKEQPALIQAHNQAITDFWNRFVPNE